MNGTGSSSKVGVYVDAVNIQRNGGYGMRYDILREFACRDNGEPVRLNVYVAFDEERAQTDVDYKERTLDFYSALRDIGFKAIEKPVRWYTDESGIRFGKANADLDMAVDALLQSENLDRVLLVTGDGDFVQVVRALQNKGCRVEVVAFQNISLDLRREADMFISGYLIPNLLPVSSSGENKKAWGEVGSRVRGTCYNYNHTKKFGFMRFLNRIGPGLWITDARREDSPFKTVFAHETNFLGPINFNQLPSREFIFEFDLSQGEKGLQATNTSLIYP
ncbi:MAG: NYN domain-containing protein [Deltaproteobacteria bacterium]|nr:NYN domain-containing protein [Deltaproteobacteria bacterium]